MPYFSGSLTNRLALSHADPVGAHAHERAAYVGGHERGDEQIIAGIGDRGNTGSIRLHCALGFKPCGSFANVGFKFGRWVDALWMQLSLNGGGETVPSGPGIGL